MTVPTAVINLVLERPGDSESGTRNPTGDSYARSLVPAAGERCPPLTAVLGFCRCRSGPCSLWQLDQTERSKLRFTPFLYPSLMTSPLSPDHQL